MNLGSGSAAAPMRRRVFLTSELTQYGETSLRRLAEAGFDLVEGYYLGTAPSPATLGQALQGIWATVAGSERYTREVLEQATDLRAIARCGVGYDAIDVDAASDLGIAVLTTPDANFDSVADFTLTLILAGLRRLLLVDQTARSGGWRPPGLAQDLYGAAVGIVGLGRIGKAVARRLRGFSCRILGAEPFPDLAACAELGIELMPLAHLLPQVDVLTLHVPHVPTTSKLIGVAELACMKRTAILINTARGGIVDEPALYAALTSGALAGAALDVFEQEPIARDNPLLECPNLILTGHTAAFSQLAARRTMDAVVDNLLALAAGRRPGGYVNPPIPSADQRTRSRRTG